ncbi:hypothetical protein M422DRAFT_242160 [Sphaerobolus stellatus SS14]|nr:hypothetical protein M422DRAFT_242160 [Sphaerobolus stellatus SS14]
MSLPVRRATRPRTGSAVDKENEELLPPSKKKKTSTSRSNNVPDPSTPRPPSGPAPTPHPRTLTTTVPTPTSAPLTHIHIDKTDFDPTSSDKEHIHWNGHPTFNPKSHTHAPRAE